MKKMFIRILALGLAMLLFVGAFTGCKNDKTDAGNKSDSSEFFGFDDANNSGSNSDSSGGSNHYGNQQVSNKGFKWPELKFANQKLTWLFWGGQPKADSDIVKLMKEKYDLTIEVINVNYNEMTSKLAALVMSGQSPDMVRMIDGNSGNFPGYIYKELIQPIDSYVDFSNNIYTDMSYYYSKSKVNGKNYMLFNYTSTGGVVVYNKKMFKEAGVTEPYTLYKQGKWDWNAFADAASKLIADTDGDGVIDRKAYAIGSADAFVYTTGQSFGSIDHANKKFKSNLKNADIARSIDFINDLGFSKKLGDHGITTADNLFKNELVAMNIIADGEHTHVGGWTTAIAKRGDLGIAPLPKDPEADKLYYYVWADCSAIPVNAKNPNAVVAYHACRRYIETNSDYVSKTHNTLKKTHYLSDENLEAYYASVNAGQPVWDVVNWAGNKIAWNAVLMGQSWATRVAAEAASTEAEVNKAFGLE